MKGRVFAIFAHLFPKKVLWGLFESVCKRYDNNDTGFVDTPSLPYYAEQHIHLFTVEEVSSFITVPFENELASISTKNGEMLQRQFGNYMELPPLADRGSHHSNVVYYDPNNPFSCHKGTRELDLFFFHSGHDALSS